MASAGSRCSASRTVASSRWTSDTPARERWQLSDGELVMPGITDAHLHLMSLVDGERQVDLTGADLDGALARIGERHREMAAAGDTDGWLLGHGWSLHDAGAVAGLRDARARGAQPADRAVGARPSRALGQPPRAGAGRDRAQIGRPWWRSDSQGRGRPANRDPARSRVGARRLGDSGAHDGPSGRRPAARRRQPGRARGDRLPRSGRADVR